MTESVSPFSPVLPDHASPGTTSHIEEIAQGTQGGSYRHATTINDLTDNALLEIFDFYRKYQGPALHLWRVWKWHSLVHVCHRWRQIILASPLRLHLRILCTSGTPVRDLGTWPAFPIVLNYNADMDPYSRSDGLTLTPNDEDGVIAALEHPDRVWTVMLPVTGPQLGKFAALMQKSFPVLTCLNICSNDGEVPVLPRNFLGAAAPCLQDIHLRGIAYPALPMLLLSTRNLVDLKLFHIPPTGYISPEVMVACLAVLPRLDKFILEYQMATPLPRIHPLSVRRTVLPQPALTLFRFIGDSEYLEDLLARIDGPEMDWILINYINQSVDFRVAHLSRLIDRSIRLKLTLFKHACILFARDKVCVDICPLGDHSGMGGRLGRISLACIEGIDWQISHSVRVLSQISLSTVVHLELDVNTTFRSAGDVEWLFFLLQFSAVQTLRICRKLAGDVGLALNNLAHDDITGEMVSEVMPCLELICLEGQPASSVEKFVAAPQLSNRPITVINTKALYRQRSFHVNS